MTTLQQKAIYRETNFPPLLFPIAIIKSIKSFIAPEDFLQILSSLVTNTLSQAFLVEMLRTNGYPCVIKPNDNFFNCRTISFVAGLERSNETYIRINWILLFGQERSIRQVCEIQALFLRLQLDERGNSWGMKLTPARAHTHLTLECHLQQSYTYATFASIIYIIDLYIEYRCIYVCTDNGLRLRR